MRECLGSIARQLHAGDELFVADGGSSDGSDTLIGQFQPSVTRWVSERDRGQAHAVNKALGWSTGDLIVWVNSDDALFPDALAKLRRYWNATDKIISFDSIWIDENCTYATRTPVPKRVRLEDFHDGCMPINQPSTVISRQLFESLGGLNEAYHFALDYDFFVRALKSHAIRTIPDPFAINRIHYSTKTSSGKLIGELNMVATKHFGRDAKPFPKSFFTKYGFRFFWLFPIDFLPRLLVKFATPSRILPGGYRLRLAKKIRNWLETAAQPPQR